MTSTSPDYSPAQALALLLRKLDAANTDLAAQVRAAIDAGKDVDEEEPSRSGRRKARRYRKAVPLSEEEALQSAVDVLQAYFIEQPLFVSAAMDNFMPAAVAGPRKESEWPPGKQAVRAVETGRGDEKRLDIELRAERQITTGGDETQRLHRAKQEELTRQRENVSRLRSLLAF